MNPSKPVSCPVCILGISEQCVEVKLQMACRASQMEPARFHALRVPPRLGAIGWGTSHQRNGTRRRGLVTLRCWCPCQPFCVLVQESEPQRGWWVAGGLPDNCWRSYIGQ